MDLSKQLWKVNPLGIIGLHTTQSNLNLVLAHMFEGMVSDFVFLIWLVSRTCIKSVVVF